MREEGCRAGKGFAMSETQVVVDGTLRPDGTLVLDERPSLPPGQVWVTMQAVATPAAAEPEDGFMTCMERVWAGVGVLREYTG